MTFATATERTVDCPPLTRPIRRFGTPWEMVACIELITPAYVPVVGGFAVTTVTLLPRLSIRWQWPG